MKDKRALLVYFEADAEKNRWFIDRLTEKAAEKGIRLDLVTPWQAFEETEAVFVINRSRDEEVSRYFEGLGIKSFNILSNGVLSCILTDIITGIGVFTALTRCILC